eukprot:scaffold50473_cov59-Attheya_sp.AAC.4
MDCEERSCQHPMSASGSKPLLRIYSYYSIVFADYLKGEWSNEKRIVGQTVSRNESTRSKSKSIDVGISYRYRYTYT